MAACSLLCLFFLLSLANVLIRLPLVPAANIGKEGTDSLRHPGKWCYLESGSYLCEESFAETVLQSSILFYSPRLTYFRVLVHCENGEAFRMPVCVRDGKRTRLERGESVRLYGTLSKLRAGIPAENAGTYGGEDGRPLCLYDNGQGMAGRVLLCAVFAGVMILCAWLFVRIIRRQG